MQWKALQQQVSNAVKPERKLEFRLAQKPCNSFQSASIPPRPTSTATSTVGIKNPAKKEVRSESTELFDPKVPERYLRWQRVYRVGPGLFNAGNTCEDIQKILSFFRIV